MVKRLVSRSVLLVILSFFAYTSVSACEIDFKIQGETKEAYQKGDELVINVKISFTHRVCSKSIQQTKFERDGLKIEKATKWKETSPNVWERKLKIKVTDDQVKKLKLSAIRTCDKDGGFGEFSLPVKGNA